ncbi:MAG: hypothetical protein WC886_06755 [Saccharofermentanaceae bacterium]|jgi:hypothetical protein
MGPELKTKTPDQLMDRLKELIAIELDHCNKFDWPYVCKISSTSEGKKTIENMIINHCIQSGITVGQALEKIERAYNPNKMED